MLARLLVRDPAPLPPGPKGRLTDLLRMRALWPVLVMMMVCYAPSAVLRGLWIGPYLADVFGADAARIGQASLVMGLAMVAGNFAYGPLDRLHRGTSDGAAVDPAGHAVPFQGGEVAPDGLPGDTELPGGVGDADPAVGPELARQGGPSFGCVHRDSFRPSHRLRPPGG